MQELVSRIAAETGLTPERALEAVGQILLYIKTEGSDPAIDTMIEETPGANEAIVQAGTTGTQEGGGLFGGGGIMALGSRLMALGLDMGGIGTVSRELVAFARQHAGSDVVDRVIATTPGLSQFA
ncbi:hypothetical protein GCM10011390_49420 [Aureimonas endophytica]|uniref:DUF2267 domain-containing protein n=1 Tax=Aureimonas endophytica TaxID=2027858 RepID=A0A917A559_9HYPH|nr:hypothetical protein [Aureimonas endophytica]GGE24122.1 hypothetical protein GCM10011390_49420 [Aureimonas endophytica]